MIDKELLLKQYILFVEMTDKFCERRSNANNYLLTVNTLIVTAYGLIKNFNTVNVEIKFIVPLTGVIVCIAWMSLINSYKKLSGAKHKVINEMEKALGEFHPYKREWEIAKNNEEKEYIELTTIEQLIPFAFVFLYIMLVVINYDS